MRQSVIIGRSDERKQQIEELKRLFEKTQSLPQVLTLTDEEIADEIEKTRNR